jgi:subtilase family serine protease
LILSKVVILNGVLLSFFFLLEPAAALGASQAAKRIRSEIDESRTFVLNGNVRPVVALALARDQGAAPGSQAMPRMSMHFTLTATQQADLKQLLAAQQNRRSPQYRKFLTPEEYANRFGLNTADMGKVTLWLENNGFSNVQAARSRAWVSFSGTAAQAQTAFHTSIHTFALNGEAHVANVDNPQLPKALEAVVESIGGLHDFRMKPHFTAGSGTTYLVPDDWETIYDVKPLYGAGLDGSPIGGQTYSIVVVGQSVVPLSDIDAFRSAAALPAKDPTVLVPPGDSGPQTGNTNDEAEADLDLEWAGAIAKNANILFVTASSAENAVAYAIDNDVAPILSTSYGSCEPDLSAGEFSTENNLFAQAASMGMTIVAAAGDHGAADCDTGSIATQGLAVDFPASSQYVTGIGGTEFNAGGGTYFGSTNNSAGGSALSYIPEIVWNDSNQAAGGGGVSTHVTKPSWQSGTGVPNDGYRDVPDIAFTASKTVDGLLFCSGGSCTSGFLNSSSTADISGGTSAGPAVFSGVLALLVQKTGTPLGLLNPNLYSLAAISSTVFHDITQGSNQVTCQGGSTGCPATSSSQTGLIGYSAGIGYDQTTGWGSIDAHNFVEQWSGDIAITANPTSLSPQPGSTASATIDIAPVNNFSGTVSLACSVSSTLANVLTCSLSNSTVNTAGSTTLTVTAASLSQTPPLGLFRKMPPLNPGWLAFVLALAMASYAQRRWRFADRRSMHNWGAAGLLIVTLGAVSCGNSAATGAGTLAIQCTIPQNAQVGVPYVGSCVASGGKSPYTYTVSAGTLPPGLSLNASGGEITGTPTVAGGNTFTINVASSNSQNANEMIGLNVAPPSPQSGTVTVTATSGGIVNTVTIPVTVL